MWVLGRRAAVSQIPSHFIDAITEIQGFRCVNYSCTEYTCMSRFFLHSLLQNNANSCQVALGSGLNNLFEIQPQFLFSEIDNKALIATQEHSFTLAVFKNYFCIAFALYLRVIVLLESCCPFSDCLRLSFLEELWIKLWKFGWPLGMPFCVFVVISLEKWSFLCVSWSIFFCSRPRCRISDDPEIGSLRQEFFYLNFFVFACLSLSCVTFL